MQLQDNHKHRALPFGSVCSEASMAIGGIDFASINFSDVYFKDYSLWYNNKLLQ